MHFDHWRNIEGDPHDPSKILGKTIQ